jgi:hypothetical protein
MLDGEAEFPAAILRACEACVLRETGYAIQLEIKAMETCLRIRDAAVDQYGLMKRRLEDVDGIGLVRSEGRFLRKTGASFQRVAQAQLQTVYRSWKFQRDGKQRSFIDAWLEDPTQQSWEAVEWRPTIEPSSGCFNLSQCKIFPIMIFV